MSKSMLSTWDGLKQKGATASEWLCILMWQSTKDLKITEYVSYGIHAIKKIDGTNQKNILLKILHTQIIYSLIKLND
jgi:hypothetical protein